MLADGLRRLPLWAYYLAGVVVLIAAASFVSYDKAFSRAHGIDEAGKASLGLLKDVSSLLTTINTAMIAAAGGLLVKESDKSVAFRLSVAGPLLGVFFCGAISYFGAYYLDMSLLYMVDAGLVAPQSRGVLAGVDLEYVGIGVGVFLLGLTLSIKVAPRYGQVVVHQAVSGPPSEPIEAVAESPALASTTSID